MSASTPEAVPLVERHSSLLEEQVPRIGEFRRGDRHAMRLGKA